LAHRISNYPLEGPFFIHGGLGGGPGGGDGLLVPGGALVDSFLLTASIPSSQGMTK